MKGIILAGGAGTRLHPVTKVVNKHLLPIYNKPMIYYPLCTLLEAGIEDILLITDEENVNAYMKLLGHGWGMGIRLSYLIQPRPEGIAQALLLAHEYLDGDSCCLILGDNVFHGKPLIEYMGLAIDYAEECNEASIFGYRVKDPERYGVVEFDKENKPINIVEKPKDPKSNYAVVGLYVYPKDSYAVAKQIKPSARGELEITDVNKAYMKANRLNLFTLDSGVAWLDTGTHDSILEASMYISTLEKRQGISIGDPKKIKEK